MKTLLFLLVQLTILHVCVAQRGQLKQAQARINQFEYAAAAQMLEKMALHDPLNKDIIKNLVLCYSKLNDPYKSEIWLSSICRQSNPEPVYVKMYAQALAANKNYSESVVWYKKYQAIKTDDDISQIIAGYEKMNTFYQDSSLYLIKKLSYNSDQPDFSPAFFKDGILFCSARETSNRSTYAWNNSAYIDLYYIKNNGTSPIAFDKPVNSKMHEGPATLSTQNDTLFFTRNNYEGKRQSSSSDGVVKLKIYYSVLKNGTWMKEQSFQFNSNEYSTGHPALSPDHKLYFVFDMPGGNGGTDIYWTKLTNGHWSTPVNLGPKINTPGNEMFPFVDKEGNLYFSSNVRAGLGGLDIFYAKINGDDFSEPANMGYPINSSKDDFGLIIDHNSGYFSSNRGHDPKDDNLYSFSITRSKLLHIRLADNHGTALENFTIQIAQSDNSSMFKEVNKAFTMEFSTDHHYTIKCAKEGYQEKSLVIDRDQLIAKNDNDTITIITDSAGKKLSVALLSPDQKPIKNGEVQIKNLVTGQLMTLRSDDQGFVSMELSQIQDYEITATKTGFKTKISNLSAAEIGMLPAGASIPVILTSATALFEKNEIGQVIELDIKYDVNKSDIRPDAAKELDKLVAFLNKNSNVKVELGSHTDARGTEEANHILSQKRAESSVRYIVSKGISRERLVPLGYGESDLKIKNATSEADHQQNRRTSVKIIGN